MSCRPSPRIPRMSNRLLLPLCAGLLLTACATSRPRHPAAPPASAAITGVPSCDAYLAGYVAGHRAAGVFPASQLQARYLAMRDSLLQAARDPQVRPYLDARCRLLSSQLSQSPPQGSLPGTATARPGTR